MDRLKLIVRLMISFLFSVPWVVSFTTDTQPKYFETICGRDQGYLSIRFPFRITNIQPKSIGYPGFDLFCDASNTTLLHLPNSGNFSVQGIDYRKQEIMLSDPDDCLAKKLLSGIDLSHSPFQFKENTSLSFYNCSEKNENFTNLDSLKISCLSTVPNYATLVAETKYDADFLEPWCDVLGNVTASDDSWLSHVSTRMLLVWYKPSCGLCEGNVTRCKLKDVDTSMLETICEDYNPPIVSGQLSKKARYAIGFSVGLGVPAILAISLMLCMVIRSRRRTATNDNDGSPSPEIDLRG